MDRTKPSDVLDMSEIDLLRRALLEWGGPARCSDELAIGMGFDGVGDLVDQARRFRGNLDNDIPVSPADWARILMTTEVVFVSDLVGSGVEWSTTSGFSDEWTIATLRVVQRKLSKVVSPFYGKRPCG
jgi:hypothetical protein